MLVQRILERGNGADRQRALAARAGLRGTLEFLVADTMGGSRPGGFEWRASPLADVSA